MAMSSQIQTREAFMLARVLTILMAMLLAPVAASAQTETVYYFHTDAVGSVRMITDANGQEVARHDYLPFGEEWAGTSYSNISNQMKYAGLERDAETGLDYALARYYRQESGIFTQADDPVFGDPLVPQSARLYGYAFNNPLLFVDPTGHQGGCPPGSAADFCGSTVDEAFEMAKRMLVDQFFASLLTPQVVDFSAGLGDALLLGTGPYLRQQLGISTVSPHSAAYRTGSVAGLLASVIGPSGVAQGAARTGTALASRLSISRHAATRMAQRGFTTKMVQATITRGTRYWDPKNGTVNYVLRGGFGSGKDALVGTDPFTGVVTTTIRGKVNLSRMIPF